MIVFNKKTNRGTVSRMANTVHEFFAIMKAGRIIFNGHHICECVAKRGVIWP